MMGMPQQGAMPQGAQGRMPQGGGMQPPQGGQGAPGGGKPGDAITAISDSLLTLADAASKTQPTTAKALSWLNDMFSKIMDQASKGGVKDLPEMGMGEDDQEEKGAKPVMDMSQGTPMGAQGMMR
jgi:hypothetical protein